MNKKTKIWLITATSLILIGLIIFTFLMTSLNWNFKKLGTAKYKENGFLISENFKNIYINTKTADITFVKSNDDKCMITCYQADYETYTAKVENDTLNINVIDNRKWYDRIGIVIENPKIGIHLPKNEYDSLILKEDTGDIEISENFKFENINIATSTGDIELKNIETDKLELTVSTGDIKLENISCKKLLSNGSTGDISLNSTIAKENISIKRSTGDVKLRNSDSYELSIKTDTGDVSGSLLTKKEFITKTSTGNVNVPDSIDGGKCEITTSTGDINLSVNK